MVKVELIYIKSTKHILHYTLELPYGATIMDALETSPLLQQAPEVVGLPTGIFSKQMPPNTVLNSGDRIEVYRPLLLDPKEKRRQRAKNIVIV